MGVAYSSLTIHDDDWTIYPNPTNDRVIVDIELLQGLEVQLAIFDASGKQLWELPMTVLDTPEIEIDLNTMPLGIYHVVLRTPAQSMVKKLVVIR